MCLCLWLFVRCLRGLLCVVVCCWLSDVVFWCLLMVDSCCVVFCVLVAVRWLLLAVVVLSWCVFCNVLFVVVCLVLLIGVA